MRQGLKEVGLALLTLTMLGCAAGYEIKGPIPPIDQHEAMTVFIMTELTMPDSTHDAVLKIVKHSSAMRDKIIEMAQIGRVDKYELQERRFRRFRIELEELLPEEKYDHLGAMLSAIRRMEDSKDNKWRSQSGSPMSGPTGTTF